MLCTAGVTVEAPSFVVVPGRETWNTPSALIFTKQHGWMPYDGGGDGGAWEGVKGAQVYICNY